MSVVNVKVDYIRKNGYNNLEEWCNDDNNVYIGRKGIVFISKGDKKERFPKQNSMWANPYKVTKECCVDEAVKLYEIYIRKKILDGFISDKDLINLKGKCLGCWCKPGKCHGDVLIKLINEFVDE